MVGRRGLLESLATYTGNWAGSSLAFGLALAIVIVWLLTGPLFGFSDTWQLVINTGTTIVTFLMVFLIQRSQNKEALIVQLKLNEIVAALKGASVRVLNTKELSEADVRTLEHEYERLAELAARNGTLSDSHSIEEAKNLMEFAPRSAHPSRGGGDT
jgi:low affinity Fe/Cu permease